jgi:hypothetical protein
MRVSNLGALLRLGTYIDDTDHEYGSRDYYPVELRARDIKVFEDPNDPQNKTAIFMFNGLKRTLTNVVLISDWPTLIRFRSYTLSGAELRGVSILAVKGDLPCDSEGYCGTLTEILSTEPRLGELDTYYVDVKPWDNDKALQDKQGLLTNYRKEVNYGARGASISITETPEQLSTVTTSDATQTVTHKIRINRPVNPATDGLIASTDGRDVADVPVTFKPVEDYNYQVNHE